MDNSLKWDAMKKALGIFLTTTLPEKTKPKDYDRIRDVYMKHEIYEMQFKCLSLCRSIEMSMIIGINDIIVPIVIEEYAELYRTIAALRTTLETIMKPLMVITPVASVLDAAFINKCAYDDFCTLARNGVPIDSTASLKRYKSICNPVAK